MTKAGQTILQQRKHAQWIAIGVFAGVDPLIAAVTELTRAGVTLADLCLAGAPASMQRLAAAPQVRRVGRLAALLSSAVEMKLPGFEGAILAASSCTGNPSSLLSPAMAERLRGPIVDACILLGAPAASAADAAGVARVLLRHSSRHVHVLQCQPQFGPSSLARRPIQV
jgi:hypothetical protein